MSTAIALGDTSQFTLYMDMLTLVGTALVTFARTGQEFWSALGVSLGFAIGGFFAASNYSLLWNLKFRITKIHHILCLIAAICTFVFIMLFFALKYTGQAANAMIDDWKDQIINNNALWSSTYVKSYWAIKTLGIEDFSRFPPPGNAESRIPLSQVKSRKKLVEIYANVVIENFGSQHPFLNKVLNGQPRNASIIMNSDINEFFASDSGPDYPAERAISIATTEIKKNLQAQTARVVPIARTILIILFLLVQLIPFGTIGYAAYKDLKIAI